jgi:hypothetical protein
LGSEGRQCEKVADINGSGRPRRQKGRTYRNIKYTYIINGRFDLVGQSQNKQSIINIKKQIWEQRYVFFHYVITAMLKKNEFLLRKFVT